MKSKPNLPALLERFFTERLMRQRQASPHTIASYRDTFRLLLLFAHQKLHRSPSELSLSDIDMKLIDEFLEDLEKHRAVSVRTRNLRLTAIRSFFRFVAYQEPAYSEHIQRVLAIPTKRHSRRIVEFLSRAEIKALLEVPDRSRWIGRRDHSLLLLAVQTGLRLSEVTGLDRQSLILETGAHVRCHGKNRKERCTPLTAQTVAALKEWLKEPPRHNATALFPTVHGKRISSDAVQYLLGKHIAAAREQCFSLKSKRVNFHCLRHTAAMELLQAGVDSSVIALWLGHESVETTQIYLHAHMGLKEAALARTTPINSEPGRFHPTDQLLQFLSAL